MWPVVGAVLPQAMAIALSPVPMVCIVLVLLSARPVRAGVCFAAGWLVALAVAVGLVAWLTDAAAEDHEEAARDGIDLVQLAVGLLFAGLAVRYWRKRPAPGVPPPRPAIVDRIATLAAPGLVLTGAAAALANLKNLPLVVSAGSYLGGAGLAPGSAVGAVAVFVAAASLTVLVPLLAVAVTGAERSTQALKNLETWLLANLNTITVVILVALASVLIGRGLDLLR
ncbi:Sap-like sulfolipid-1-addressing protein [Kribbella sp. VKM Ac-2569]|uniref:GAP family protein n=1 Tax=Kribbella sp. VKM Ac-2569 TaxID=2512220 RepID=UPI0010EEE765|nr:GAP family protein [Kribbella sp. VKM Ac-2569]RZT07519.1 Sap-like sulfolipid-1-addressing protein [Kribbella sp. VKM Ac-2569]